MEDFTRICELLQRFYRAFNIPASIYKEHTLIKSYVSIVFEPNPAYVCLKEVMSPDENRVQFINRIGVLCGYVRCCPNELYILIGPVSSVPCSAELCSNILKDLDLPISRKKEMRYWLQKTPVIPENRFLSILKFLDLLLNGTVSTPTDALSVEFENQPIPYPEITDQEVFHNTRELETEVLHCIETGQPDRLLKKMLTIKDSDYASGLTGMDVLRSYKNLFITAVVLVSRAAIRGGMDYDYALTLSDYYIRIVEKETDPKNIFPIEGTMMMDFCEHVHRLNRPAQCSALTLNILKDVQQHLRKPLTVGDIAARQNRSESGISHIFKKEMNKPLKTYIQEEKIREARQLLASGKYTIAETSHILCFSSQSHFQTVFRQVTGMTPGEFAKKHRSG